MGDQTIVTSCEMNDHTMLYQKFRKPTAATQGNKMIMARSHIADARVSTSFGALLVEAMPESSTITSHTTQEQSAVSMPVCCEAQ
mmetsp:Transcript_4676/g.12219  ORF Transcript_4676/g.12219 Transcript_4676/m.12219 type:complete len:85 (+) Transcript_4676:1463-1717(+)